MKMKKITCAAVASAMALSMSAPALAVVKPLAETSESSFQVELEGMIYTPVIRVQVSESGNVYVNPTKGTIAGTMSKTLDGTTNLDYSFEGLGVASTPIVIRSDTDKGLDVSATATATVPKTSGVQLTNATVAPSATDKLVKLRLSGNDTTPLGTINELKTTSTTESDGSTTVSGGLTADNAYALADGTTTRFTAAADGKSAAVTSSVVVAQINAAQQTKDSAGKVTDVVPQYGVVTIAGDAAGKAAWSETDVVNVSVALTFGITATS